MDDEVFRLKGAGLIEVVCPNCGAVMAVFDKEELTTNKAIQRAYDHLMKGVVICGNCRCWVEKPGTATPVEPPPETH